MGRGREQASPAGVLVISAGTACQPATGFLCLESEGSPVEFRAMRIRELP